MPLILVIDDDEFYRTLLKQMLENAGYDVLLASDGRAGIRCCEARNVHIVITDILMPDVDGIEVINKINTEFPDVKIIAMSAGGQIEKSHYLKVAKIVGAMHTVTKPIDKNELMEAVRDVS